MSARKGFSRTSNRKMSYCSHPSIYRKGERQKLMLESSPDPCGGHERMARRRTQVNRMKREEQRSASRSRVYFESSSWQTGLACPTVYWRTERVWYMHIYIPHLRTNACTLYKRTNSRGVFFSVTRRWHMNDDRFRWLLLRREFINLSRYHCTARCYPSR